MPNSPTIKSIVMTALEETNIKGNANINQIGQVLAQHVQKFITNTLNVREAQFQEADIRNLFLNSKAEINVKNIDTTALAEQIAKNLNAQSEQLQALAKQEKMQQLIQSIKQKYQHSNELPDMLGGPTLTLKEGCYVNLALIKSDEQIAKEQALRKQSKLDSESTSNHTQRDNRLSSFEDIHRPKDPLPLNKLFVTQSDETTDTTADKPIQRVLMLGRAGIGKSTLCQYLAYRWADDAKTKEEAWLEEYDVLLWIKLRELISLQESLKVQHKRCGVADVVTISCVFGLDSSNEVFLTQAVNELIHDSTKTILWVLDGFDEVAHLYGNAQHPLHTVLHELFPRASTPAPLHQVLLTSRPYATQGLQVDRTIENIGLLDKDIPRYVTQYFNKLSKPNPDLGKIVAAQIKSNPNIHGMAHVPINAYLICHLYQKESNSQRENTSLNSVTLTQLYQRLVVDLCKRMVNQPQSYQPESNNRPNRLLKLHDKTLIHRYQQPLWVLAHLAFSGLTQTQSLTLPWRLQNHILDTLDYEVDDYVNHVLPLGLLKTICETTEDTTEAPRYFMHLTFQEFFAALYLVWSLAEYGQATSKDKKQALHFLKNDKYTPRYQVIFWFAAGLVRHAKWFNNDDTIQQTALTNLWEKGLLSEPQDITGYGQFHLLAHAFEEGEEPTSLSTSSQDNPINTAWTFIKDAIDKTLVGRIVDKKNSRLFKPLLTTLTVCPHLSNNPAQILVKYLQHDNWKVRGSAINALAQLNVTDPLTIQLIAERLTDDDWHVRDKSINALAQLNVTDSHILQLIAEYLKHKNKDVCSNAINALAQLNVTDPLTIQLIAEHLDDKELDVRYSAINALAQLNVTNPHILQRIAERLTDKDWNVRQSAINALAQPNVTDIHTLQRIAERLTDDNGDVRYSAINALAQLNVTDSHILQRIAEYLQHEDPDVRYSAINALAQLNVTDSHILQRIAERLDDNEGFVRQIAINALAQLNITDTDTLQRIAERSTDDDWYLRDSTINALAQLNITDTHILQRIAERLDHNNWRVRKSAIDALAKLNVTDIYILQRIVQRLDDNELNVLDSAFNALAQLNVTDPHILKRIAERLDHNNWRVRVSAIYALAQLHIIDSHILQRIAERLDDNEPDVRFHAIEALAQLNVTDPHILQRIAEHLSDDWYVRYSAINALAQLNVTDIHILQHIAERLADNEPDVRDSAVEALNRLQHHLTIECWLPVWDKRLADESKGALSDITAHHLMVAWIDKHLNTQTNCHLTSNASLLKISRLFAKWIFDWLQLPLLIDENQHTFNMITTESADKLTIPFPNHPLGQTAFKRCKQALELESFINPVVPFPGHTHSHTQHLKPEHRFNALQQHLEHYLNSNEDFDFDYVLQNILYTYASLFEQKPELWQRIIDLALKHPANYLFTKNPILHHTYKTTPIQTTIEARNKSVDDLTAKGKEYSSKAKLDNAIQQYEQAVMSNPNYFSPYHNLASLYQAKAHSVAADEAPQYCELAEYSFNQAMKLKASSKLYTKYGQFLYIQQRYEKALPLLTQAIKTTPDVTKINLSYHSLELLTLDTTLQTWLKNHKTLSINSAQLAYYLKYRCYEALGQTQQQAAWLNQWAEWLNTSLNKDSESWLVLSDSPSDSNEEDELSISQHLLITCQKEHAATPIHTTVHSNTNKTNDESPIYTQTQPLENQHTTIEIPLTTTQPALQTTTATSSAEADNYQHRKASGPSDILFKHPVNSLNTYPLTSTPTTSLAPAKPPHNTTSDNEGNTTQNADTLNSAH